MSSWENSMQRKRVCILGSGNAGLYAAIMLKTQRRGLDVIVVGSQEIGIVGVGESSTEHVSYVMRALGIKMEQVIKECHSTFKFGVWFDWQKEQYVHSLVGANFDVAASEGSLMGGFSGGTHALYRMIANDQGGLNTVSSNLLTGEINPEKQYPNQFHFDTFKLNEFLIKKAKQIGIAVFDDIITDYEFDDNGYLKQVESETNIYPADLFVDCSGFQRLLAKQVDEFKWVSQQHNLFVDSAFAFPTEHAEDNYKPFTIAKKMSSGWMWQIPVYTRQGNGYCYSSKHITEEEAVKEVEAVLGHPIKIAKRFNFDAGHMNKTWHKNMVLCGLASHFFEPLEATSMGVSVQQARLLVKYLEDEGDEHQTYNELVQRMFKQMWTFIRLHYHNAEPDSPFWQDVVKAEVPAEVQKILDIASYRMLLSEDINVHLDWYIFHEVNFNQVLYGVGALSAEVAKKHCELVGYPPNGYKPPIPGELIKHKEWIDKTVNENSTNN